MTTKKNTFQPLQDIAPTRAPELLGEFAKRHDVWLACHDVAGVLELPNGTPLLPPKWRCHQHPVCVDKRKPMTDPVVEEKCLDHCWRHVHVVSMRSDAAFEHRCWRNQREIVVPVYDRQILCLVLFILPQADLWRSTAHTNQVACEARSLGLRLIRMVEPLHPQDENTDRRRIIERLLACSSHKSVERDEVARHLGVSYSRACHIITEIFGKPWRELLTDIRVQRAQRLLRQRSLRIEQVSWLCGYDDPNTFARIFRKRMGVTPTQWRRQLRWIPSERPAHLDIQ